MPIANFVVDFACLKARLIIEVDGGQHALRRDEDAARTRQLGQLGYQVIRFWNNEILQNLDGASLRIREALSKMSKSDAEAH